VARAVSNSACWAGLTVSYPKTTPAVREACSRMVALAMLAGGLPWRSCGSPP
jgi:hypothetical protein